MKLNLFNTIIVGTLLSLILGGCSKDYQLYDEDMSSVRFVYSAGKDSTVYSFALHPNKEEDIIEIPLNIIGFTKDYTREVGIEIDKTGTTAMENINYLLEKCEISENSTKGTLKVIVKRTPNLKNEDLSLSLKLKANENFVAGPIHESNFRIILSGRLIRPSDWPGVFGDYSRRKHEFVIETIQIGTEYGALNSQQLIYYVGLLNTALYEYNKNHPGEPLVDENDRLITF